MFLTRSTCFRSTKVFFVLKNKACIHAFTSTDISRVGTLLETTFSDKLLRFLFHELVYGLTTRRVFRHTANVQSKTMSTFKNNPKLSEKKYNTTTNVNTRCVSVSALF